MTVTERILESLVNYPTVSKDSNLELIEYIQSFLSNLNIQSTLTRNEEGTKANLYSVFGPGRSGGVMLSGHTDVVPVQGQNWTVDPFSMVIADDRCYGRGTTDMKGFIASVLAMVERSRLLSLKKPVHLAFSYDEEIGCVGVRRMIDMLESAPERPDFCIVGEPTNLEVGVAHKGKTGVICRCRGVEAHSALATEGLNAIYLATEMIQAIRNIQNNLIEQGTSDEGFIVPYSTLHVGTIQGGTALNIIPNYCEFKFEIRNLKQDDPGNIMKSIQNAAESIVEKLRPQFPNVAIELEIFNQYPALNTKPSEVVVDYVKGLVNGDRTIKLDFGTEGGLFQNKLGIPTVVCGPGSMEQGHKPDEFIMQSALARCDRFLDRLLADLT